MGQEMGHGDSARDRWLKLSDREQEVASLAALGVTVEEIARTLFLAKGTVKTHLGHIYDKLAIKGSDRSKRVRLSRIHDAVKPLLNDRTSLPDGLELEDDLIGREVEAKQIEDGLADPNCRVIVLRGMHGSGKSLLARNVLASHFAERPDVTERFGLVECEAAEDPDIFEEITVALGGEAASVGELETDAPETIARILAGAPFLLLIESFERALLPAEDQDDLLRQFDLRDPRVSALLRLVLGSEGGGKIIITTTHTPNILSGKLPKRLRYIGRDGRTFGGLDYPDAQKLLRQYATGLTGPDLDLLIGHFEGHPEALMWSGELLSSRETTVDEITEGWDLSLQQRIYRLLGRVYRMAREEEVHVLNSLAVLRRPAQDDLLTRIFELNPPKGTLRWDLFIPTLVKKCLIQSFRGRAASLYYVHALVRDLVAGETGDRQTYHSVAALAYEEAMEDLWDKRREQAEECGLESIYQYAACHERGGVRQ